jgi:translation initiation factor IF-2
LAESKGKAKGFRINELAKELGVESKDILSKLGAEEMIDLKTRQPFKNHMATLSVGQAETVRSWAAEGAFASGSSSGGVATALEEEPPSSAKPKRRPPPRKKAATTAAPAEEKPATAEGDNGSATVTTAAPAAAPEAPTAPPVADVPPAAPAARAEPAPAAPIAPPPPSIPEPPTAAPPSAAPAVPSAPSAPGIAAKSPTIHDLNRAPVLRETITLSSRGTVDRKPVQVAPQLQTLAPAQIKGPSIVRVEKADNLPAPRPRGPLGPRPGDATSPAGYSTARPVTGRGVKVSEDEEEAERKKALAKKSGSLSGRRRGGNDGRRGEAMEKLREFTEADLIARRDALNAASATRAAVDRHLKQATARGTHVLAKTGVQKGEPIQIEEPITVKSLSATLGVKSNDILKRLMQQGVFATINQSLDRDTAATIALEYGIELTVEEQATMEEELVSEFISREVDATKLVPRPPVVTILGHVDHGKTSLLDKIRSANVAAGEAGGITQHTAAWTVEVEGGDGNKKRVTFIDTPGHQAFTSMRARGAQMTDVVVLVVAAVEGVMPQTVESINHARAAKVPIVVALNKIDRPDANPDMVLGQLAAQQLNPVEWGGDIEVIRTSATTGQGIKDLIEILDYQSQLLDLKADPTAPARGTVIESRVDPGLGSVATVLVQDGTLHVGDVVLSGAGYGRIRSLLNDRGQQIQEAGPSTPVVVSGLSELPSAGEKIFAVDSLDRAAQIAEERGELTRRAQLAAKNQVTTAANLFDNMKAGDVKTINLIIKADVQGSVETLTKTVTDYNTDEVKIQVIHSAVGGITESDVELAAATKDVNESTVIIGFHVVPDEAARQKAEQMKVEIRTYRVIYEIFDDMKKALSGMLEPEVREKLHGHCEVRQVFKVSKLGNIAGCFVTDGHIQRGSKIRLTRGGVVITENLSIETLKRVKDDVKEVKSGLECGIKLANYDDIKVGDILEAYVREEFQRTL